MLRVRGLQLVQFGVCLAFETNLLEATGDCLLLLEEGFGGAQAAWKGGAQAAWKGGAIINRRSPLQHFDFVAVEEWDAGRVVSAAR